MLHSNELTIFIRAVEERSSEARQAIHLMYDNHLYGQVISILRQELDSFIRVVYLLSLSHSDRIKILKKFEDNKKWPIKDFEMISIADNLNGWTRLAYSFGCSFIHLTVFHDHKNQDLSQIINSHHQADLKNFLENLYGRSQDKITTLDDLRPYFILIFEKISDNLKYYLSDLVDKKPLD